MFSGHRSVAFQKNQAERRAVAKLAFAVLSFALATAWLPVSARHLAAQDSSPNDAPEAKRKQSALPVPPKAQAAIDKALKHLLSEQLPSGGFPSSFPIAETSVAGLALLRAHDQQPQDAYLKGFEACRKCLLLNQRNNGLFAGRSSMLYEHAYALQFLASAERKQPRDGTLEALQRGVDCVVEAQNEKGCWRYRLESLDADVSITSCMALGLLAAKEAGAKVPAECFQKISDMLRSCQLEDGSFTYIVPASGKGKLPRSAAAMAVLTALHERDLVKQGDLSAGERYVRNAAPADIKSGNFCYGEYYRSILLRNGDPKAFQRWYDKTSNSLIAKQLPKGTWPSSSGTSVYTTASICLVLLSPHRAAL
ncbi:MAG: prenyltransferase/squalene oxidase repeat-containing protein [Planctomycetota bacterium]